MKTYDCKLTVSATVSVCMDNECTKEEIERLIRKYGFNVIFPNGDIRSLQNEKVIKFNSIKVRKNE